MKPEPPKPNDMRRLDRQFDQIERLVPALRRPMLLIRSSGWWIVRLPLAIIFITGGILSFLPILGLWMLPMGLLLLAIDLPLLRGPTSAAMITGRRRYNIWHHRRLRKNAAKKMVNRRP